MTVPSLSDELIARFERLKPGDQQRLVDFAEALDVSTPRGVPGKDLLRFAGILPDEDAEEMMKIIEEGCERVDYDEW